MRLLWWELVRYFWPFAFHDGPHFFQDVIDTFDFEHVFMQSFKIGCHHNLAADKPRSVGATRLACLAQNHQSSALASIPNLSTGIVLGVNTTVNPMFVFSIT